MRPGDELIRCGGDPGSVANQTSNRPEGNREALTAKPIEDTAQRSERKFKMILQSIPWDFFSWGITREVIATFAAHGNSICVGLAQGFSAVLLPQINDPGSTLILTSQEASWVASLGVISNPLGAVASGIASEVLGRRAAVRLAAGPYLAGWLLIALADDFLKLCIGRFICGVAVGMATSSYVYVAEVSGAQHRGTLCASGPVFVSVGVLLVYVAGAFVHWTTVSALACVASAVAYAFATAILPETPPWLVTRGRMDEARESLEWLRGSDPSATREIEKELAALMDTANAANETRRAETSTAGGLSRIYAFFDYFWALFSRPQVWKPFVLLLFFFAFQEASGIYVLLYYAVDLFRSLEAGHTPPAAPQNFHSSQDLLTLGDGSNQMAVASALIGSIESSNFTAEHTQMALHKIEDHSSGIPQGFLASIAVAGVRLIASIGGASLMQRFGRRELAMASGAGMAVSMAIAGGYEFVYSSIPSTEERPAAWVPLACVLTHVCVSMIGFLQLPWVMTSELFPQTARGVAGGSVAALAHLLIFASVKTYPDLEAWAGVPLTLWLFSGAAAAGALFVYVFLPETKGKTLAEIEDEFAGGMDTRGCAGSRDGACYHCGQDCSKKNDSTLAAVIVKPKQDHCENSQSTQNKSLATILRQHCFHKDEVADHHSLPFTSNIHHTDSNLGLLINDKLAEASLYPCNALDDSPKCGSIKMANDSSQMDSGRQKSFWTKIFHRKKDDYVPGIGVQEVTAISVISVCGQTNSSTAKLCP